MRLGIQHGSSKTTRGQEETGTKADNDSSPNGEKRGHNNLSLLRSVGEVVISAGHVPEGSSLVHSNETSIEILRSSIQLHTIGGIGFDGVFIVVVILL